MNKQQIIDEVRGGASLAQVAKRTGINRMTISNVIFEAYETGELPTPSHQTVLEGLSTRKKIREYAEDRGVFSVEEACEDLDISIPTLNRHLRGLELVGRVLPKSPAVSWRKWTDEDLLGALRDVWDEARADGAIYLSVDDYELRRSGRALPSASAITGRFLNWSDSCFEAGVPTAVASSLSRWTADDHKRSLQQFYSETGERTMVAYNRWSRGKDVPSSGIIHKHTGSWNDAINWVIEEAHQPTR